VKENGQAEWSGLPRIGLRPIPSAAALVKNEQRDASALQ
jgi:hypothetical protein